MLLPVNAALAVVMAVLLAAAVAGAAWARFKDARGRRRYWKDIGAAGLRATLQLGAVSLLIGSVIRVLPLSLAFMMLMFAVATRTAGRRITADATWKWAAAPIAAGVIPVLAMLTLTGLVPLEGLALIPVAGILIGGALTATVLAGRRALDELRDRRGEVEAALALGFPDRDARTEIARPAASEALIPGLDQTRTVGLVTLPGAFVGMLLGGSSPVQAGAVQLFVLIALMAVQTVAVAVTLELVTRGLLRGTEAGSRAAGAKRLPGGLLGPVPGLGRYLPKARSSAP
ncbi:ABC transporter permease [Streptomyces triticagri]|uniref:ABC transporter permease n=1 Tax=Streptomyces triticagri TaxID=2293568 RepID=A0A372M7S3_9ACTN|nr:ABC transporter permease [Streptomyces triticagri]RFU86994.1 ABC transporter permease [Streptomyces triticagri]